MQMHLKIAIINWLRVRRILSQLQLQRREKFGSSPGVNQILRVYSEEQIQKRIYPHFFSERIPKIIPRKERYFSPFTQFYSWDLPYPNPTPHLNYSSKSSTAETVNIFHWFDSFNKPLTKGFRNLNCCIHCKCIEEILIKILRHKL